MFIEAPGESRGLFFDS